MTKSSAVELDKKGRNFLKILPTRLSEAYAYFFSEHECNPVTVRACINLTLLQRKTMFCTHTCTVTITLFSVHGPSSLLDLESRSPCGTCEPCQH